MSYDIKTWLKKQPAWLQEAAVRLQSKKTLSDDDIACITKSLKDEIRVTPDLSKFQIVPSTIDTLRLVSLGEVKGIDTLNPRKPLSFGKSGNLSVVYGRNGSGKSGYTRILKRVCGKSSTLLRHNVFGIAPTAQTCSIKFSIAGIEQTQIWDAKGDRIVALSAVDIFDGSVGDCYLRQENEASYMPQEMTIFTELVSVCDKVSGSLIIAKNRLVSKLPSLPNTFDETIIAKQYQALSHKTTQTEVASLTSFSEENRKSAQSLRERLNVADPAASAKKQREIKKQIQSIKTSIEKRIAITTVEFIANIRKISDEALQKREAATEGAQILDNVTKLEGIGQTTWKALWEAARAYSIASAYQGHSFPQTGENARCVLCQQELNDEAKNRLNKFETFVTGILEVEARTAEQTFDTELQKLPNVVSEIDVKTRFQAAGLEDSFGNDIWAFIEKVNALVEQLQRKNIPDVISLATSPVHNMLKKLVELANSVEQKAVQFDADAKVFDRKKAQSELCELEAKQWVSEQKDAVFAETERLKLVQRYDDWIRNTNTRSITTEAGSASEQLITVAYVRRFNTELGQLGAKGITVELVKSNNVKGRGKYRIQLKNARTINNPEEILSDGEKRIVSLAAFLADVTVREVNVPFVFDDPISSLDQEFEERTIDRLVELGKTRQVIVFTHRLSFLSILTDKTEDDSLTTISINNELWGSGEPSDVPINAKKPEKALKKLQDESISQARRIQTEQGQAAYDFHAQAICSDFRKLMERMVEIVLLADVVQRHRRAINTKGKVQKLAKIKKEDCDLIDKMMTKYSCYEHSQSNEAPVQLPSPDDLEKDIKEVLDWHNEFSKRP